jgi:hypothetical protein
MNTYTAAGLGVQCIAWDYPWEDQYQGIGIAQITLAQTETPYGELVLKVDEDGKPVLDDNGKPIYLGAGVRCYIRIGPQKNPPCTVCMTPDEYKKSKQKDKFVLEAPHDPTDPTWARIYMRRRIQNTVNACKKCSTTDIFIVAALAQQGSGFTFKAAAEVSSAGPKLWRKDMNSPIRWSEYFEDRIANGEMSMYGNRGWFDTRHQLDIFANLVWKLKDEGWYVPPDIDWNQIWHLAYDS